jgi:hypothetical protein
MARLCLLSCLHEHGWCSTMGQFLLNANGYIRCWLVLELRFMWLGCRAAVFWGGCRCWQQCMWLKSSLIAVLFVIRNCATTWRMFTHAHEKELGELRWYRILMRLGSVVSGTEPNQGNEGCRCDRGNLCTHIWAYYGHGWNPLWVSCFPLQFPSMSHRLTCVLHWVAHRAIGAWMADGTAAFIMAA